MKKFTFKEMLALELNNARLGAKCATSQEEKNLWKNNVKYLEEMLAKQK